MVRKKAWQYRYSVKVEGSIVPSHRTDDLAKATHQARIEHSVSVNYGRGVHYTVYDHVELREVFNTRRRKRWTPMTTASSPVTC